MPEILSTSKLGTNLGTSPLCQDKDKAMGDIIPFTPAQVRLNRMKATLGLVNSDSFKRSVGQRKRFGKSLMKEIDNITIQMSPRAMPQNVGEEPPVRHGRGEREPGERRNCKVVG